MSSLPLQPGDKCRMRDNKAVFTVLEFNRGLYRLQSEHGAELRAGRRAVRRVFESKEKAAEART